MGLQNLASPLDCEVYGGRDRVLDLSPASSRAWNIVGTQRFLLKSYINECMRPNKKLKVRKNGQRGVTSSSDFGVEADEFSWDAAGQAVLVLRQAAASYFSAGVGRQILAGDEGAGLNGPLERGQAGEAEGRRLQEGPIE